MLGRATGTARPPRIPNGDGPEIGSAMSTAVTRTAASPARSIFTPGAIARVAIGWLAVAALTVLPASPVALIPTIAVIVTCSFGVVRQAERLAVRLGDPLGTLVLTLSIVLIEVVLIVAVMLGPGEHSTIARDSVVAVAMIILNLVIGVALLVGGLRHGAMRHNRAGTSAYLAMLVIIVPLTFGMPQLIGVGGSFTILQARTVIVLTAGLYGFFLWRQTGAQTGDFAEVGAAGPTTGGPTTGGPAAGGPATARPTTAATRTSAGVRRPSVGVVWRAHRRELLARLALLVLTVLPIVLLSHDVAAMLDDGLGRMHAPAALSGILIAAIVFLPETITTVRAAYRGEIQRVSNLCHGALVSTVGLTVPAVLAVGLATGQHPVLAAGGADALLLAASLVLSIVTFSAHKVTALHGAAHLALFVVYALTVFA